MWLSQVPEALHLEDEEDVYSVCDATDAHCVLLGITAIWVIVLDLGYEEVEVSLQGKAAGPATSC